MVLTPRRWRQVLEKLRFLGMMVANKPGHQGEREGNRNTIVQGMPGRFRCTCGDYRVLTTFCTRAAGAPRTRHFPRPHLRVALRPSWDRLRPLIFGADVDAELGRTVPRERETVSSVIPEAA